MTGYPEVSTTAVGLMKPFTPVALARRVREILDKT